MANWEYKIISSGKGGFASPALMEKFLNDVGRENWEIISFHQPPDNPLAFHGLCRRSAERDWTLEDAAKAAARAEADKLRAEFEAKFKAGSGQGSAQEEEAETFLAEEKAGGDGDLRRLRDTSRDDDPEASDEENGNGAAPKDEWDKLAEEDELPTFFDALRPHMRRNQRGPGMSVGVDFLAKKWHLDESDLKGALVECGLQIPADENAKPVYVEYEGELYWVNINRRGEIWINLRDKPQPVFRIVQAKRVEESEEPASNVPTEGAVAAPASGEERAPRAERPPREERERDRDRDRERERGGEAASGTPPAQKTFLDKVRGMMRRNRHGHGFSGSFQYLTKALKMDEAGLLAQLAEHGVKSSDDESGKTLYHEAGDFVYWLQKNQRGEIWINARKGKAPAEKDKSALAGDSAASGAEPAVEGASADAVAIPGSEFAAPAASAPTESVPAENAAPPAPVAADAQAPAEPVPTSEAAPMPAGNPGSVPPENALSAMRLLMQPKKRGEGVTAQIAELAEKLGKSVEDVQAMLTGAGLALPESPKAKPTFVEQGGEVYWLNLTTRGQLWLNAKDAAATRRSRAKKSEDEAAGDEGEAGADA